MITEEIIEAKAREAGKRSAINILVTFIWNSEVNPSSMEVESLEVWLAHVVDASANCKCSIELDHYDSIVEFVWCEWYTDPTNRRQWFIKWMGTTEEELRAKEREAAAEEARLRQKREAQVKASRLAQLHELAREFNVDPRLLP